MTDPDRATRLAGADLRSLASIVICSVIWGTTWYAITLQLGTVDPTASVTYRFALASVVLFLFCWGRREPIRLSARQHLAVFGQGVLTFSIQYSMVYEAEQHIASAVVAVIFAGLAFVNLVLFRVLLGQRADWRAWVGAMLGVVGVAAMFIAELRRSGGGQEVLFGLTIGLVAMVFAAAGNLAAWKAQKEGAPVLSSVAWAMAYGAGLVFLFGLVTGVEFSFEMTPTYVGSLLYLSIFGSVVAFALYFMLARAKGYALASYISALTPPVALLMSVIFEDARFGWVAALGVALVLVGQVLLIRAEGGLGQGSFRRNARLGRFVIRLLNPRAVQHAIPAGLAGLGGVFLGTGAAMRGAVGGGVGPGLDARPGLPSLVEVDDFGHREHRRGDIVVSCRNRHEKAPMVDVIYRIVQHADGWAYKLGETFSETYPTREAATAAAHRVAGEQHVAGETRGISWEDENGNWHTELSDGHDRPDARVAD